MGDRKVILLGLAPALKFSLESNSMSEFGGLWKQQNNPACTKSVSLHHAEVGHYAKEAEEEEEEEEEEEIL